MQDTILQSGQFLYKETENGIEIVGYTGTKSRVELPGTIDGKPVTALVNDAFAGCRNLTELRLNEGLVRFSEGSLRWLLRNGNPLQPIRIPASVTSFSLPKQGHDPRIRYRFHEDNPVCFMDDDLCYTTDENGGYTLLFCQNRMLAEATVNEGTVAIAPGAFGGEGKAFVRLKRITLPASLEQIGANAFSGCPALTDIAIPAGVRRIDSSAFEGCKKLSSITVAEGNTHFTVVNGALFTADMRTLLVYPPEKKDEEYTLPDTVEDIGTAFAHTALLKTLHLPASIRSLANGAFPEGCGIRQLYLAGDIRQIGPYAFGTSPYAQRNQKDVLELHVPRDSSMPRYVKHDMKCAKGNVIIVDESDSPEDRRSKKLFAFKPVAGGLCITQYLIPPYGGQHDTVLEIPAQIGGKPVVELGKGLFREGSYSFEEVVIPEGVKKIGDSALYIGGRGKKFTFPASVTKISKWVFTDHSREFKDLNIDERNVLVVPAGSYAERFFREYRFEYAQPKILTPGEDDHLNITIDGNSCTATLQAGAQPTDRLEIPALYRDMPVRRVVLCKGEPNDAFDIYNMPEQILSLSIPATVEQIGGIHKYRPAQKTPEGLPAITVAEDNPHFWSDGHALYTKDRKTLLQMVDDTLEEYTVCEDTAVIADYAFIGIRNLKRVTLSQSTRKLGKSCFYCCSTIEMIHGLEAVEEIGDNALMSTAFRATQPMIIVAGKLVSYQGQDRVFTVPEGVETIGEDALRFFSSPDVLEEVVLPSTVRTIEADAFTNRTKLRRINLPEGLETIGQDAFAKSYGLESLHLPSTLGQLPPRLFCYRDYDKLPIQLRSITVAEGNPLYSAQDGVLYNKDKTQLLFIPAGLEAEELRIPETVRSIKSTGGIASLRRLVFTGRVEEWEGDFSDCENLAEVVFMNSCPAIPGYAFDGCKKLRKVTFPKDLRKIGDRAFRQTKLAKPELPDTLEHIGEEAFARCGIKTVTVPASVRTLGWGAFSGADEIEVYDTIEPDAKPASEGVETSDGGPNGMVGFIGMGEATAHWSCAANHKWRNYTITVRSAETGEIKYKVWMGAEQSQRAYYCLLSSGWGHNATFAFAQLDEFFSKIRGAEHKLRVAQLRLEYPVELTDEAKKKYEAFVKKNAPKGE